MKGGKVLACHISPRCGAHSKRSGQPCRAPAMKNGRCYMHGGKSGRKPTHGMYTKEALAARKERQQARERLRVLRKLIGNG